MQKTYYPPRKKNVVFTLFSRFFYGVLSGAIFLIGLIVLFFALSFNASLNIYKEELFEIKQGQSLSEILNEAKDNGLIRSNISLLVYAVLSGIDREIQFGVYELKPGMNSYDLLLMISGKGNYAIKGNKIAILEGYAIYDIVNVFQKNDIEIDYDVFINIDNDLRKKYSFLQDIPKNASLEGFLFPDTYYFSQSAKQGSKQTNGSNINQTSKEILEKFLDNFESKVTNEIKNGFKKQGLGFYQGIILASIVESEVWNKKDKPIVASVLLNRLRAKMPLQVDSTIIYSLKSNGNNNFLTPKNTLGEQFLDIKSLYNTYKNTGLPPSPISNPGIESLLAVAEAPDTFFWYYLSRQDTGETIFSKNLDEHNENRYKYLR
ncbi:MAG: hypothetical protein UR15_C0003G0016 [Parcubacteria group bacterium GW2011_GWA2_31_28]|nr:MAG: hypothetical protein UR15_C0003G0016 [Parcubacteria group bacterium GW2011_GWA2_31_28]